MISLEELHSIVWEEIDRILLLSRRYRCYEIARMIASRLKCHKLDIELRDGIVEYDIRSLLVSHLLPSFDFLSLSAEEERKLIEEQMEKAKNTIRVAHSWCDMEQREGTVVVDFLPRFVVHSDTTLGSVLTIGKKEELPHTYCPVGRTFGRWLIIPTGRIPYVTRLRMGGA